MGKINPYGPDFRNRARSLARGLRKTPSVADARKLLEKEEQREHDEALDVGARILVAESENWLREFAQRRKAP